MPQNSNNELSYIRDLETGETLRFDFFQDGNDIPDSVSVDWGETAILGRSEPFRYYGGTSKRSLSVSLIFCGSVTAEDSFLFDSFANEQDSNGSVNTFEQAIALKNQAILRSPNVYRSQNIEGGGTNLKFVNDEVPMAWRVVHQVNFLRSFLYPVYVRNNYGGVIRVDKPPMAFISLATFLKFKGLVTEVGVTWKRPFISDTLSLPMLAEVNVTFDVVSDTPYDSFDVRNTNDYFKSNQFTTGSTPNLPRSFSFSDSPDNYLSGNFVPARQQNNSTGVSPTSQIAKQPFQNPSSNKKRQQLKQPNRRGITMRGY